MNQKKINQLLKKLENLSEKQEKFSKEIISLKNEINNLKSEQQLVGKLDNENEDLVISEAETSTEEITPSNTQVNSLEGNRKKSFFSRVLPFNINLEKIIGENLIGKLGISAIVIGVGIGVKYAIDNQLISPSMRIILGYLSGIILLGFALRLKVKYINFSAVLLSGSMAIIYFISYAAYGFYDLIPEVLAFTLMVTVTVFTVVAALQYNRQVIAHIGMVGAYAVPFIVSDNASDIVIFLSYIAIINSGILFIAFKKYWKPLYFFSFVLTWLIFYTWFSTEYQSDIHFEIALLFLLIFFITFYLTFLSYKLLRDEKFQIQDTILILANSFIFFGIGYAILDDNPSTENLLGLFSFSNTLVHALAGFLIYSRRLADRNLFYLVSGLALIFLTITIPVQFNAYWVTLFWSAEALLLFWIGRTRKISFYEYLSYPMMILAFFSLIHEWSVVYSVYEAGKPETRVIPLLNINLLSSIFFVVAFAVIHKLNITWNSPPALAARKELSKVISFGIPAILLFTLFIAFNNEIECYWNQLFKDSYLSIDGTDENPAIQHRNYNLLSFKSIWSINYFLLFGSVLSFINIKKLKNEQLGLINLGFNIAFIFIFLSQGLISLGILRESYLEQNLVEFYSRGDFHIIIRYISYAFIALILFTTYTYISQDFLKKNFRKAFDYLFFISILILVSSELINILDLTGSTQSDRLWLSLLWGAYSLIFIITGIRQRKKYLRVLAIVLFGITLLKLFFYDIAHLETLAKTVVFVCLGILLLIISFLYTKYTRVIFDED